MCTKNYIKDAADEKTICLEWDSMSGLMHQLRTRRSKKKKCKYNYRKSHKRRQKSKASKSKSKNIQSKIHKQNSGNYKYFACKQNGTNKESTKVKVILNKKNYCCSSTRIKNCVKNMPMDAVSLINVDDSISKTFKSKKDIQQKNSQHEIDSMKNIVTEQFSPSRNTSKNQKVVNKSNAEEFHRLQKTKAASLVLLRKLKSRRESIMEEHFGEIMERSIACENNTADNLAKKTGETKFENGRDMNRENETGLSEEQKIIEYTKTLKEQNSLLERQLANSKQN